MPLLSIVCSTGALSGTFQAHSIKAFLNEANHVRSRIREIMRPEIHDKTRQNTMKFSEAGDWPCPFGSSNILIMANSMVFLRPSKHTHLKHQDLDVLIQKYLRLPAVGTALEVRHLSLLA